MPQSQISSYMEFDNNGGCVVGGNRSLSDAYIQRLVHAMEVLYYEKNGIHPLLVADAKLYLYPDNGSIDYHHLMFSFIIFFSFISNF